jgi:hypothetical protein
MATTSQVYVPIFRTGIYDLPLGGVLYSFPVDKIQVVDLNPTIDINGTTMNAVITVQAPGLNQVAKTYFTSWTSANIASYSNGGAEPTTTTTTTVAP